MKKYNNYHYYKQIMINIKKIKKMNYKNNYKDMMNNQNKQKIL